MDTAATSRRAIEPALGAVSLAKITAQVLEEFYADLRRCRYRCRDGEPAVVHRTAAGHECRSVRHRRRPAGLVGSHTTARRLDA